jgi:hypothetical protein
MAQSVNETIEETGAIFAYILDTSIENENALSSEALVNKAGWTIVEADVTEHEYAGDVVLLNDVLALVLRKSSSGAELYARNQAGYALRATLSPVSADDEATAGISRVIIIENTPGAVALECSYRTDRSDQSDPSDRVTVQFRLITGQIYVETRGIGNAESLAVRVDSEYLVIPDFFADDLVYQAKDLAGEGEGLPAENFLMHLVSDGDALVTCVWKKRAQHATAISEQVGGLPKIAGTDIMYSDDAPVWVAVLERPGVWYAEDLVSETDLKLDWAPPFAARWRANFLTASEAAESWNFEEGRIAEYASPFHNTMVYPCWFDGETAYLHANAATEPAPSKAVVYPIDRTQGTPLDVFCLVDIMRGTLGFGACQYVLDLEGLDAQSSPTPALVMDWVEKQFKAGRDTRSRGTIEERLAAMVDHVNHADARIKAYGAFARELIASIGDNKALGKGMGEAKTAARIHAIASELVRADVAYDAIGNTVALASEEAAVVVAAIGQPRGEERCAEVAERLHSLGSAQDRVLSKGRTAVRRIAQIARDAEAREPGLEMAATVLDRASELLRDAN